MTETQNKKPYDLGERTFAFAKEIREICRVTPKTPLNIDDIKQLVRSSGSVGANYIEANEALSKKDFIHRIGICRKESKESGYWIRLLFGDDQKAKDMFQESKELVKIFNAIIMSKK